MSNDAAALKAALGLAPAAVVAADFTREGVEYQAQLGVTGALQDMLVLRPDWVGQFDVVVDAAFTDVFTSDWNGRTDGGVRRKVSTEARTALANLLKYVAPGGVLLVKSMVQSEEQYARFVGVAAQRMYTPRYTLDSASMLRLAAPHEFTTRSGRTVKAPPYGCDGHTAVWEVV